MTLRVLAPPAAGAAVGRSFSGGPLGRTVALRMRARAGQGRSGAAGFSPRAQMAAPNPGTNAAGPPASRSGARKVALDSISQGWTSLARGAALRHPLEGCEFRPSWLSPLSRIFGASICCRLLGWHERVVSENRRPGGFSRG